MKKRIVIIGSSGHGRVVKDNFESQGDQFEVIGYLDNVKDIGRVVDGLPVIGRQDDLVKLMGQLGAFAGVVAVGDNFLREKVVNEILNQLPDFEFVNSIHKSVIMSPSASMGCGNVLMPGVIVNSQAKIRNHCFINSQSTLEHDGVMENYSSISVGVTTGGHVTLGEYSSLALGVTVLDRVRIGCNVVIGSGSLVTKNIEDDVLAYGVPAKFIRRRERGEKYLK